MADIFTQETRSYVMSRIRSTNTTPEMIVRKFLHAQGFRFRIHQKTLVGKPDIVLRKHNSVIFVNGCFWHGHVSCKLYKPPKTRSGFWRKKISNNKKRDAMYIKALRRQGWKVMVIWECKLHSKKRAKALDALVQFIMS